MDPDLAIRQWLSPTPTLAIDVRSEIEFAEGAIPGSINLPILNTQERHQVGQTYKSQGQDAAIAQGYELVGESSVLPKDRRLDAWIQVIQAQLKIDPETRILLWCWRGGLRSQIADKALRTILLQSFGISRPWHLILGPTGSGKSDLLHGIVDRGSQAIDLERRAHHRGSAFGGYLEPQPSQATFENQLALDGMRAQSPSQPLWIEDEHPQIGRVRCPEAWMRQWIQAPGVVIRARLEERALRIFDEYVERASVLSAPGPQLSSALARLEKRLGRELMAQISAELQKAFQQDLIHGVRFDHHEAWITGLLKSYYDPLYAFDLKRKNRKIIFEGNFSECLNFIPHQTQEIRTP